MSQLVGFHCWLVDGTVDVFSKVMVSKQRVRIESDQFPPNAFSMCLIGVALFSPFFASLKDKQVTKKAPDVFLPHYSLSCFLLLA